MQDYEEEERERRAFEEIMSLEVPLSPDAKKLHDMKSRMEVMSNFVARRKMEKEQVKIRAATKKKNQIEDVEKPKKPVAFDIPAKDCFAATPPKLNVSGQLKHPTPLSALLKKPPAPRTNVGNANSAAAKKIIIKPSYTVPEVPSLPQKVTGRNSSFTNRDRILRSLQYSIFPNAVDKDKLEKVKKAIELSTVKHFIVLFRDEKLQFRGLYSWKQESGAVERIYGVGPAKPDVSQVKLMFKYADSRKTFTPMKSKDFGNLIDGFTINDSYWHKTRNTLNSTTNSLAQLFI